MAPRRRRGRTQATAPPTAPSHFYGAGAARLFLIRPDGHVASAGGVGELGRLATYLDGLYTRTPTAPDPGPDAGDSPPAGGS